MRRCFGDRWRYTLWDTLITVQRRKRDAEVRIIFVKATAEVRADRTLVYAVRNTGIDVCAANEMRLANAFDVVLDRAALAGPTP